MGHFSLLFVMVLQLPTTCEIVVVNCCSYMLVGQLRLHAVVMMCLYVVVLLIYSLPRFASACAL